MTRIHTARITARIVSLAVLAAAASVAAASAAAAPAAAATSYAVTNLGSLGGADTVGAGISATGQVTGHSTLSTEVPTPDCPPVYGNTKKTCVEHPWHAFFYSNGQMTDVGTLGGNFSDGNAINRSGWVAGESATKNRNEDAFLWNGQKMLDLGQQAPLNGNFSSANGINDSGQVAGTYGTSSGQKAFLYSNGIVTGLPDPGFTGSSGCQAYAINNNSQIAGACTDTSGNPHLVLWQNGAVTDLGTLATPNPNPPFVQDMSINGSGQIAGSVFNSGVSEGFSYSNGSLTNLGSFTAAAINDGGVMVGGPDIDSGGTVQDLNTMLPAGSPTIQYAVAINDNGQIVANTTTDQTLLLTPA